jgi:hypothetical protein
MPCSSSVRREGLRQLGVVQHDRGDRVLAGLEVEAGGGHALAEIARVVHQPDTQIVGATSAGRRP